MKIAFILNPHSGGNQRRPGLAATMRDFAGERKLDAQLWLTEGPGHATVLARQAIAQGCDRVIAAGGDGTVNEIARVLIGTTIALGLMPCGSGNGLGRHLGLHRSIGWALELVTNPQSPTLAVDTGTVNGRPFCNVMGLGFDAELGHRFNQLERRGPLRYAGVTLRSLRDLPLLRCTIIADGETHTIESVLIAVANSPQYGNHAVIAPGADVTDGRLDLIAVRPISPLHAGLLLPRLFLGNLTGSPQVFHRQVRQLTIEREAPGRIHTDGETFLEPARLEVVVHPCSLNVIVAPPAPGGARPPQPVSS